MLGEIDPTPLSERGNFSFANCSWGRVPRGIKSGFVAKAGARLTGPRYNRLHPPPGRTEPTGREQGNRFAAAAECFLRAAFGAVAFILAKAYGKRT